MSKWLIPGLAMVLLCAVAARGQVTGPVQLNADSSIDQVLDALHARGEGLKDFTADVSLAEMDPLTGDTTTQTGKVWYQATAPGDARIRVLLDRRQIGDRVEKDARNEYLLDKGWLVDRDYKRKVQVDRQVLKPGQKMNLLKLGEGPFPLPIGQDREDVLKMFTVSKLAPAKDDPAGTVHIQLKPKPGTQFERKFESIDVWVDTRSDFPRRIQVDDKRAKTLRTTDLTNIQINTALGDNTFALEKVDGWVHKSEPMGE